MPMPGLARLQHRIGVTFSDENLLLSALTHPSYVNEYPDCPVPDSERLEFLGDAVLNYLTADYLYRRLPGWSEGRLTVLRALVVRTETLSGLARDLDLGEYLLLGKGEEASGGRRRAMNLCAAFEALVGAVAMDKGLDQVRAFFHSLIEPLVEDLQADRRLKDPKSRLQELAQARFHLIPAYRTVAATGPDHAKRFTVEVRLADDPCGRGIGASKRAAQQAAAREALRTKFGEMDEPSGAADRVHETGELDSPNDEGTEDTAARERGETCT